MHMRSLALLITALGAATACSVTTSHGPTTYPGPWKGTAASFARAQPATPVAGATAGSISGRVGYPSEFLPAMATYAISTDGDRFYRVESVAYQQHYTMLGVAPGDYFVLTTPDMPGAIVASGTRTQSTGRFMAAYTKAVLCGLSVECGDHSLVPVHVSSGVATTNVDPGDWYADPSAYPLMPQGEPPTLTLASPPTSFDSLEQAAIFMEQSKTGGRYVRVREECPVNAACGWLTSSHLGQGAAYYLGSAGSNSDILSCAFYLVGGAGGWRPLGARCTGFATAFPAVGAIARVTLRMGEQGCVNVHDSPGISARVVACLNDGAQVQIDDGPIYIASKDPPSALDVWWHIAGRGWIVDQYLGYMF